MNIIDLSAKPKNSSESVNVLMQESEDPVCSTEAMGREQLTSMEDREIGSDELFRTDKR